VERMPRAHRRSDRMRDPGPGAARLPSGALAPPAVPEPFPKRKLPLCRAPTLC
jgi:hypothetical protein